MYFSIIGNQRLLSTKDEQNSHENTFGVSEQFLRYYTCEAVVLIPWTIGLSGTQYTSESNNNRNMLLWDYRGSLCQCYQLPT
jgi:hypothetical protein